MECAWQVELDDFCNKVLEKHWPDVPKYKDVRDVGKHNLETVDLICGGFPCQDVSLAGKRKGLEGKRSTLWSEFYRIICEIRPRWIVIENVRGLFTSDDGRFFAKILRELSKIGYDAEWQIISSASFGSWHKRERVFILAYTDSIGLVQDRIFKKINYKKRFRAWPSITTYGTHDIDGKIYPKVADDLGTPDGIPATLDEIRSRLKSLGNAVVPQVAEFIGTQIMKVEQLQKESTT